MLSVVVFALSTSVPLAETVDVKYRGAVDLKSFACTDITRSSFIQRACYDKAQSYNRAFLQQARTRVTWT
ncbi:MULTISPECIES: hypothetical protein [unclassified Bradyrhizobium]|uniref:hypothetical protein n=1 Tax=unclassified Bradyrhizobium TaxID=2631580 RepID=UPI00116127FF|nr:MULTISPECIES: hypothetical protein [unclassified Bradyrhizobium]MDH2381951.1 hypothetical protein [Bradyrhizobium sp. CER78]